jgi:hypothetical protein
MMLDINSLPADLRLDMAIALRRYAARMRREINERSGCNCNLCASVTFNLSKRAGALESVASTVMPCARTS